MPSSRDRLDIAVRAGVDLFTYVLVLTALSVVISGVLSLAAGGGAVGVKLALFLIGWGLLGYATWLLWPTPSDLTDDGTPKRSPSLLPFGSSDDGGETVASGRDSPSLPADASSRFQALVRATPPARWVRLPPPEHRIPVRVQLFVASLCILLTSFLLERVFQVA